MPTRNVDQIRQSWKGLGVSGSPVIVRHLEIRATIIHTVLILRVVIILFRGIHPVVVIEARAAAGICNDCNARGQGCGVATQVPEQEAVMRTGYLPQYLDSMKALE